MERVADRGRQDLRLDLVQGEDLGQLANDDHAVLVDVVQAAHERRDEARAGLGGKQALVGREDERAVRPDAFVAEPTDRLQAVLAHRHLDVDVRSDLGEVTALFEHALDVVADDLRGHWTGGDLAHLGEEGVIRATDLGIQGWIRGHAIEHAPAGGDPDLVDVRSVQEDLHRGVSVVDGRASGGASTSGCRQVGRFYVATSIGAADTSSGRSERRAPSSGTRPSAIAMALATNPSNSGCGRSGRLRNSGWNWLAMK